MKAPLPEKFVDKRGKLPVHKTRKFASRRASDIKGVVFHQAAGNGTAEAIARYHVAKNHISPQGCPGICYVFYVERDGTVVQCHDLTVATWSQGNGSTPVPGTRANTNFLGVCFAGDFDGPGHDGSTDKPTLAQLNSAKQLWFYLRDELGLEDDALWGHKHFGKPACPGYTLSNLIDELKSVGVEGLPVKIEDWQSLLVKAGYNLGKSGPNKDGVDGDWGTKSRGALQDFQQKSNLPQASWGMRDKLTALALAKVGK